MKNVIRLGVMAVWLAGCSNLPPQTPGSAWSGDNEKKIEAYLKAHKGKSPVAVFDWDNTVAKNDVGDAMMIWMLKKGLMRRPASWKKSNQWLNSAALKDLDRHCADIKEQRCIDTIMGIYLKGMTSDKQKAWQESFNPDTMEPGYAWLPGLFAGHTPDEIRAMAEDAVRDGLDHPVDGSADYLRVYPQMKKLIADLQAANVDVWIVSASPQVVVEVFGKEVGVAPDHVIGVRNVMKGGKYTEGFEGCGPYRDGNQQLITFRQGKRCWINKQVFGMKGPRDQMTKRSPISFAAGDSDTDVFFLRDAQDLRVVVNRNKTEVMCHAYSNKDGRWIVNPMFIEPMEKKKEPYDCRKFGLKDYKEI